jgi:hypothetical protein
MMPRSPRGGSGRNKNKSWPSDVRERISEGMRKSWQEMDDKKRMKVLSGLRNQNHLLEVEERKAQS